MGIEMATTTDDDAIFERDWAAQYVRNDVVGLYALAELVFLRARVTQVVTSGATTRTSASLPLECFLLNRSRERHMGIRHVATSQYAAWERHEKLAPILHTAQLKQGGGCRLREKNRLGFSASAGPPSRDDAPDDYPPGVDQLQTGESGSTVRRR